jgi:hypothetical protein
LASIVKLPPADKLISPQIIINNFPHEFSLCRDVSIKIIDFKFTGFRKSSEIKWQLIKSDPIDSEIDSKLSDILNSASNDNLEQILIPSLTLA